MLFVLLSLLLARPSLAETPATDGPLTELAYIELGLPAAGRTWTASDYETAGAVLQTLPDAQLPAADSPHFQRLVAQDNLEAPAPGSMALDQCLRIGAVVNPLLMRYLQTTTPGASLGPEVIGLMGFLLRWNQAQWQAADAFLATQPADFLDDPARAAGLDQMRSGTATVLSGALTSIEAHAQVLDARWEVFATELVEVLPGLLPRLGEGEQAELRRKLDTLLAALPDGAVKTILTPAGEL